MKSSSARLAATGGMIAAQTAMSDPETDRVSPEQAEEQNAEVSPSFRARVSAVLGAYLKILRSESGLRQALEELNALSAAAGNPAEVRLLRLAAATVNCALFRKESRGAHRRTDYPAAERGCQKQTIVTNTEIFYREIPERRSHEAID